MSQKEECKHDWARIWLRSRNYEETRYCRKCLELWNNSHKKRHSENTQPVKYGDEGNKNR